MKPIIKYRGGKSKEIPNFIQFIPQNYDRYVEPFLGGAALYFYLEPHAALINDINDKLINFYLSVRNNFNALRKELTSLETTYISNQIAYEKLKATDTTSIYVENKNEALYYLLRDMFNAKIEKKYSMEDISSLLATLGGKYVEIAERRKHPVIDNNEDNVALLNQLKNLHFISTTSPENDGIRIYPPTKQNQ